MKYSTESSTPTCMSFTFLLANHLLNQFLFCILMVNIKPTKKQKGMLIVIIPVSTASKGGVYCITSQNGLNSTLHIACGCSTRLKMTHSSNSFCSQLFFDSL